MLTLNRYVLKEVFFTFVIVLGVLSIILLSHRFARYLAESVAGNITGDVLLILVGFHFLTSLTVLIPIAVFFSILIALGRLYKDNEMYVMFACGVSQWQLLKPLFWMGVGLSVAVAFLSMYMTPFIIGKIETLKTESESVSQFTGVKPGQFKLFESGERVFYFEDYENKSVMRDVLVYQSGENGAVSNIITADQGQFVTDKTTGAVLLIMTDGHQYQGTVGAADFRVTRFRENAVRIQRRSETPSYLRRRARPTWQLLGTERVTNDAEFHWRLAMPIGSLIFILIAVPLSRTTPRQGRFAKLFAAILVYVAYNNLLGIGRTWIEKEIVPPSFGLWWVHVIFLFLALILMLQSNGVQWRFWRTRSS